MRLCRTADASWTIVERPMPLRQGEYLSEGKTLQKEKQGANEPRVETALRISTVLP
jgi:hypothetical protein